VAWNGLRGALSISFQMRRGQRTGARVAGRYERKEAAVAEMLLEAHSGVRYLVLLAGVAAAIAALLGWRRGNASGVERVLAMAFVGLIDIQVLLGLVLLIQRPFYGALTGHVVMMVASLVVAHVGSVMARRRAVTGGASRVRCVAILATLLLLVGGIAAIRRSII
jgi:hypothetical protein